MSKIPFSNQMTDEQVADWYKKYYPITAYDCMIDTPDQVLEHSLTKWQGIKFCVDNNFEVPISVGSSTCACCEKCNIVCEDCDISKTTGEECDDFINSPLNFDGDTYYTNSYWGAYNADGDPQPMIDLLELAIANKHKLKETK